MREGSLEAPVRHPIDWKGVDFFNEENLFNELDRVFDICHGCRRCFNLCNAFLYCSTSSMSLKQWSLIASIRQSIGMWLIIAIFVTCVLCQSVLYVPPHEWDLDFLI